MIKNQLRIIRPFVAWFGWMIAPTEIAQVTKNAIARIRPPKMREFPYLMSYLETDMEDHYGNAPVKYVLEITRFLNKSGALHTMERTSVKTPATSRQKSVNAQKPISFFEGILASDYD